MLTRLMLLALLLSGTLSAAEYWVAPVPAGKDC
jgi:hypothetical protein